MTVTLKKKKVPLKEMIETLQEKGSAVGPFVAVLNDMKPDDIAPKAIDWTKADIDKALAGDPKLKQKLQEDLNTNLDGTPLPEFRPRLPKRNYGSSSDHHDDPFSRGRQTDRW